MSQKEHQIIIKLSGEWRVDTITKSNCTEVIIRPIFSFLDDDESPKVDMGKIIKDTTRKAHEIRKKNKELAEVIDIGSEYTEKIKQLDSDNHTERKRLLEEMNEKIKKIKARSKDEKIIKEAEEIIRKLME